MVIPGLVIRTRAAMRVLHRKFLLGIAAASVAPFVIVWAGGRAIDLAPPGPSVPTFAGNPQHTAIYQPTVPNLNRIRWSATIDANNSGAFAHYGAPLVTAGNTVIAPVKIAATPTPTPPTQPPDAFRVDAFDGLTGTAKYSLTTDYILPSHNWIPVYNPCLATGAIATRLYYAGAGGTVFHVDNPDSAVHGPPVRDVFYTTLTNYTNNASAFNSTVFVNTPLTADSSGNVFFGFRVQGTAPAPLNTTQSGFARIDPTGAGTYILAGTAANDANVTRDSHNSAPALSNDEATVYVVAKSASGAISYLLGLDSTTLAMKYRVQLKDPRNGNAAQVTDDSTASPTVAPDNDVYFGILGNPGGGFRGWLLRFSSDLGVQKLTGGFGWDYTPAIVPSSMVPSYHGGSSYLLFCKYNNYAFSDGNGVNRVALLDPNASQLDPHSSAPGFTEMREVLTLIGPTPDVDSDPATYPYATREWCINTAAVNPATNSIFVPNEDGRLYRWNVATNSFAEAVTLTAGTGEPYVPSVIGPDGTVFTLNGGTLFALGPLADVNVALSTSAPDVRTLIAGQPVTFTATVTNPASPAPTPSGTVTFVDFTYQDFTPITTTLGTAALDANGQAALTTSTLAAGNGFLGNHLITATYNSDNANFPSGSAKLMQKVHAFATTTTLSSSPNPSNVFGPVQFTAMVSGGGATPPTGMVTFEDGSSVRGQIPLSNGMASLSTTSGLPGDHTITATYQSDTFYALSSGTIHQIVQASPTATPTATATVSPTATASATATATATATPTAAATPTATATVTPTATATTTPTPTATATPTAAPTSTPTATPSATAPQAVNLSTRMRVDTGDNVGIGGFIISGNAPKHVLLRGIGPSLAQSGVANALADPVLQLYRSGSVAPIAVNNNWRDSQEESIKATGIPPVNDSESAIDATLAPGNYTAVLRGNGGGAGVALVEVYDLDPASSKLANISTRAFVSTGPDIAIAGFILGNQSGADRIVVRGIGPSLASAGVPNPLANPVLELRNGDGVLLISNNDWQDNPVQAAQLIAAGLAPSDNHESGIFTTLPPGSYTALLAGESGGTGIGLVEVYDLGP
ncbi:MAG: Ig-like domain-containing protein [Chthoniobacterales bacterium]